MARTLSATPAKRPAAAHNDAAPDPTDVVEWDREFPSLGLRKRASTRTWIIQTRIDGRSTRRTLGVESSFSREAARLAARAVLDSLQPDAKNGVNFATISLADFAVRWLEDCAGQWKPATIAAHRNGLRRHILPALGNKRIASFGPDDIADWFGALPCNPAGKNRLLAILSGMMRHAELLGIRSAGSNPCAGMRRKKSSFVATVLRAKDYARLGAELARREQTAPVLVALIRFLAVTGCRRGEAETLRWDWIDGARAALPDAKSGPRSIWLGKPARDLLAALPRTCDLVFGEDGKSVNRPKLAALWRDIRTDLGMPTLRLHDLRHSFATTAVSANEPLRTVAGLLGHSDLAITEGYTHLAEDTLRKAAATVGAHLQKTLSQGENRASGEAGPVVPDERRKPPERTTGEVKDLAKLVNAFGRSSLLLPAFCELHGLDPKKFRKAVNDNLARAKKGVRQ